MRPSEPLPAAPLLEVTKVEASKEAEGNDEMAQWDDGAVNDEHNVRKGGSCYVRVNAYTQSDGDDQYVEKQE